MDEYSPRWPDTGTDGPDAGYALTWQPEMADYVEAFAARNRSRRARTKQGVLLALVLVLLIWGAVTTSPTLVGGGIGGLVAIAFILGPGQRLSVGSFWRRASALRQRTEARVSIADGVTSSTTQSTGRYAWSSVESVLETERVFVVQIAGYRGKAFLLLAKRGLGDPADVAGLRALLTHPPLTHPPRQPG